MTDSRIIGECVRGTRPDCQQMLEIIMQQALDMGIVLNPKKLIEPIRYHVVLGVKYDLIEKTIRISDSRKPKILTFIDTFIAIHWNKIVPLLEIQNFWGP